MIAELWANFLQWMAQAYWQGIGAFIGLLALLWTISAAWKPKRNRTGHATPTNQNRQHMIEKVRTTWIEGVLKNSLYGAVLIDLDMVYDPDAVEYPWDMVMQRPQHTDQRLPPGTRMADVFSEAGSELLILGAPGAGKTTMLLDLALTLLDRAAQDETLPIPVVFNLSSWAEKRLSLADWLVEELYTTKYHVSRKIAQAWIESDHVLPLLDGLDEVAQAQRDACVDAINAFRNEHGLLPLVVCSRSDDYAVLTSKLRLHTAITIQPLTRQQIRHYLKSLKIEMIGVITTLQRDPTLLELLETPLLLSIVTLAYRGKRAEDLAAVTPEQRRKHLFETYVAQMLKRKGKHRRYTPEQTKHWLTWLAGRMVEHSQTVFYIERMQPTEWLNVKGQQQFDQIVGLLRGFLVGASVGSITSFVVILISSMWANFWSMISVSNAITIILSIIGFFSVFFAVLGFMASFKRIAPEKIELFEELIWPAKAMRSALITGIGIGIVAIPASIFFYGWLGILAGSATGIAIGSLILSKEIKAHEPSIYEKPNQGVWKSARNALKLSLITGISFGLSIGFNLNIGIRDVNLAVVMGLLGGVGVGTFNALFFGAETYIKHFLLRGMLYKHSAIPRNYAHFLDHCHRLILLRKVGGGYIFIHRMLLEYLAGLEETR